MYESLEKSERFHMGNRRYVILPNSEGRKAESPCNMSMCRRISEKFWSSTGDKIVHVWWRIDITITHMELALAVVDLRSGETVISSCWKETLWKPLLINWRGARSEKSNHFVGYVRCWVNLDDSVVANNPIIWTSVWDRKLAAELAEWGKGTWLWTKAV